MLDTSIEFLDLFEALFQTGSQATEAACRIWGVKPLTVKPKAGLNILKDCNLYLEIKPKNL